MTGVATTRKRRITAFLAGRIVEAFASGLDMVALAARFRRSRAAIEATVRRHAKRRRDR